MSRYSRTRLLYVCLLVVTLGFSAPAADEAVQSLPFEQDWTNTDFITTSDDWSGVPGIIGYRGDGLTGATGVDPQTVLGEGTAIVDVNANLTNPNTFTTGGASEFHIGNPVVALQGSGTARAPHIVVNVSTLEWTNVRVAYNLRDVDGSADNAVQPVALQYRVGASGSYTNVSAGFVADATTGPSLATLATPVSVELPDAVRNQALVQIRIITTDAVGSDEWVGIDDIAVTGSNSSEPTPPGATGSATPASIVSGGSALLTVAVTPGQNPASTGLAVTVDLTSIGGSASQPFFDDGTNGDATADDSIVSYRTAVIGAPGGRTLPVSVTDAEGRTAAAFIALSILEPTPPPAVAADVVISQVYGGGGNSGATYTHDFIELHNRESVDVSLAGWSVQYAASGGTSWTVTPLTGTVRAGAYYVVQQAQGAGGTTPLPAPDAIGTISMAAGSGKVALAAATGTLTGPCPIAFAIDFVGYGSANCFEGTGPTATLSNTTAAHRKGDGAIDTDDNASDFMVAAPLPHRTPPSGVGRAMPASLPSGGSTLLTVTTTQGTFPASAVATVVGDLSAFDGGTADPLFDDGSHGDLVAGDAVFSIVVPVEGAPGFRNATFTITDAIGRSSAARVRMAVEAALLPISSVQGAGTVSLLPGEFVTTSGIVTAHRDNGYFVQTPDGLDDGNPQTSEGLFVFTGTANAVWPMVGDAVRVSGTVVEFPAGAAAGSLTELGGGPVFHVAAAAQPLPAPVELLPSFTAPTADPSQLERFEGMRVAATLRVIAPSRGFKNEAAATATSTGEFYAVIDGVPRPVREPGLQPGDPEPPGLPCCVPRFDGNPERLRVLSDMQPGAERLAVASGQRLPGVTGVLDFTFGLYTVLPDPGAAVVEGQQAAVPVPTPFDNEFTVASFNLERFYDEVNDAGVDDVALTPAAVERRLSKASLTIRNVLRLPDILGVVEVENLSILERLASRINADALAAGVADPGYTAHLHDGNDVGGIDVGFLVKRSRVDVFAVTQEGKDATFTFNGDTRLLNDRPPLVLDANVHGPGGAAVPVTVIVNHLRSFLGITDPADGARVRAKRAAQAEFLAGLVQARQASGRVIVVGDFNAFPFNDGLVDVMGTIVGRPAPADQVADANPDVVDPDLANLGDLLGALGHYSYVFDGNAQAIDHILVNERARSHVGRMHYARSNADFPESLRGDATRPERLSDHDAAVAYFGFAPMAIEHVAVSPTILGAPNHRMVDVGVSYTVSSPSGAASCGLAVTSNEPVNATGDGDTEEDWEVLDAHRVRLRAERSGTGAGRIYTVAVTCTDAVGNMRTTSAAVAVPK
jgi:hypothetical protein